MGSTATCAYQHCACPRTIIPAPSARSPVIRSFSSHSIATHELMHHHYSQLRRRATTSKEPTSAPSPSSLRTEEQENLKSGVYEDQTLEERRLSDQAFRNLQSRNPTVPARRIREALKASNNHGGMAQSLLNKYTADESITPAAVSDLQREQRSKSPRRGRPAVAQSRAESLEIMLVFTLPSRLFPTRQNPPPPPLPPTKPIYLHHSNTPASKLFLFFSAPTHACTRALQPRATPPQERDQSYQAVSFPQLHAAHPVTRIRAVHCIGCTSSFA